MIDESILIKTFGTAIVRFIPEYPDFVWDIMLSTQLRNITTDVAELEKAYSNRDLEEYINNMGELLYTSLKLLMLSGVNPQEVLEEICKSKVSLTAPDFSNITKKSYENWGEVFNE